MNKTYKYINQQGVEVFVKCTRLEYLYLKLNYGINGLTIEEYKEYKKASLSYLAYSSHNELTAAKLKQQKAEADDFKKKWVNEIKLLTQAQNQISFLLSILTKDQVEEFEEYLKTSKPTLILEFY